MSAAFQTLRLIAPLDGVIVPLEAVPDPVFAQRMAGDGVSLDPTSGEVLAPVAGVISQLHESRHAFTITEDNGLEVLTHVGVDTVLLKGAGFVALAKKGERVALGQAVLRFDVDGVARKARSLLTQVLVANPERVRYMNVHAGRVVAGKDVLIELELKTAAKPSEAPVFDASQALGSDSVVLKNPLGLHARPASVLAACARTFSSEVRLVRGKEEANAKSVVSLLSLSTRHGDVVQVRASGVDAAAACKTLAALLVEGCGEQPVDVLPTPLNSAPAEPKTKAMAAAGTLGGEIASRGLASGPLVHFRGEEFDVPETAADAAAEELRLRQMLAQADAQLAQEGSTGTERAAILSAHRELLQDPEIIAQTEEGIKQGQSAAHAWRVAYLAQSSKLELLSNPLLRERAVDVRDVGQRVLRLLACTARRVSHLPEHAILLADELTPSDVSSLDRKRVAGLCMVRGGITGHVAILAKAMGIPALCGMDASLLALPEGRIAILDAEAGLLRHQPDAAELGAFQDRLARVQARHQADIQAAAGHCSTTDGHRMEVVANVQTAEDIREALALGAEGVGLLRSEFLFEDRATAPSEEEHYNAYRAAAEALGPTRPLVIRTLDVGGDKPLPFLPMPKEDNPFLGLRGIRVSLDHPDLFRAQLRGILRAAPLGNLHIMFPMIATLAEFRAAKSIVQEEMKATGQTAKIGLMIEVPSAALLSEAFAREADFFSIGTNDLTQYTLAMDRGHARLAKTADALEPAVLKLISATVQGAHRHGRWVGVCGGIASDALAIPLLIGLGVDELSMSPPAVPAAKAQIRRLSLEACRQAATAALEMSTAAEVRKHLETLSLPQP